MNIERSTDQNTLRLKVIGRLESTAAPQLNDELDGMPEQIRELILDFSELEYMSSAGLRSVLTAHKKMKACNGMMKIQGVNACVKKLFDLTGFTPLLHFE